jgi:hypothetical protein
VNAARPVRVPLQEPSNFRRLFFDRAVSNYLGRPFGEGEPGGEGEGGGSA